MYPRNIAVLADFGNMMDDSSPLAFRTCTSFIPLRGSLIPVHAQELFDRLRNHFSYFSAQNLSAR